MAELYTSMAGEIAALRSERERDKTRIRELEFRLQAEVAYHEMREAERVEKAAAEAAEAAAAAAEAAAAADEKEVEHSVMGVLELI